MRLLLVFPKTPTLGFSEGAFMSEPLTLEYLAAGVPKSHDVRILDLRVTAESLTDVLIDWQPDAVGITGFTLHVPEMVSLSREVKSASRFIKVLVGGHHATFLPNSFMVESIDMIARGECEGIMGDLLDSLYSPHALSRIPGLIYRDGSAWQENGGRPTSIFAQLTPPHHLVMPYNSRYHILNMRITAIQATRGCPYHCRFCDSQRFFNRRYQTRDTESIVTEIAGACTKFIFMVDENFGINGDFLSELAHKLADRGVKKRYLTQIGTREILNNRRALDQWFDLGLRAVFVGIERLDDADITGLRKGVTASENLKAIDYIHSHNGIVMGSFIVLPDDTPSYFRRLEEYARRYIDVPVFCVLTPLPGTELWDEYAGVLDPDFSKYDLLHATIPTLLPESEFYRHFHHLYTTLSWKRLAWKLIGGAGLGGYLLKLPLVYRDHRKLTC